MDDDRLGRGCRQGLQHDPANAESLPSYPYAYGHRDPAGLFRTVMAYGSPKRIAYFSNPRVLYNGKPTGTDLKDNARALTLNTPIVAEFVPVAVPVTP